jgi:hypothetical protein
LAREISNPARDRSRKERKGRQGLKYDTRSKKSEAQNSKQIQMIQTLQILNESKSDSRFWILRILDLFWFGLFGISIFGFRIFFSWRKRDENILGDLPTMQWRILLPLSGTPPQEDQASLPLLQPSVFGRRKPQSRGVRSNIVCD